MPVRLVLSVVLFLASAFVTPASTVSAGSFDVDGRADARLIDRKVRAAEFLSRVTFGPTVDEIESLATRMMQIGTRRACIEWIDDQMALPPTLHQDTIDAMLSQHGVSNTDPEKYVQRYRYHAFYHNALRAPDQLRQRVAWALSQIFVVSDLDGAANGIGTNTAGIPHWYGHSNYYDKLVAGGLGDYRELLGQVATHPIMGQFLSSLRNAKADPANNYFPDENFARELMQLFSIGLYELEPDGRAKQDLDGNLIPTYDMETVKSFARVFTGMTFKDARYFYYGEPMDFVSPMEMWEELHDTDEKVLLGGTVLPARGGDDGDGMADVNAALDNVASHPNIGPFLAKRLIQRLVRSNPSRAYIRRVVQAYNEGGDGSGGGGNLGSGNLGSGNLGAMVKAILIDAEAFRSTRGRFIRRADGTFAFDVVGRGTDYSRMQEPMMHYVAMLRGLGGEATFNGQASPFVMIARGQWEIGQSPFGAPSVFNFYLPTYQPPGALAMAPVSRRLPDDRLTAPEFTLMTPVMANRMANLLRWYLYSGKATFQLWNPSGPDFAELEFDYDEMLSQVATDREALMDRLNLQFCRGMMPDQTRADILDAVQSVSAEQPWTEDYDRLVAMLYCVLSSPDCWIVQ